ERTLVQSVQTKADLAEIRLLSYDPLSRRAQGTQADAAGRTTTNTWDWRWESPVEIETTLRRTTNTFNRDETITLSSITDKITGEQVATLSSSYDPATQVWRATRSTFHRPGILLRTETESRSPFGKLIATRAGDLLDTRSISHSQRV